MSEFADHDHDEDDDSDTCGPPVNRDNVDDFLESMVAMLEEAGYADDVATDAVYTALEALMESGGLTDTPDLDQPAATKHAWVANAAPQIVKKLREIGLEFEEE